MNRGGKSWLATKGAEAAAAAGQKVLVLHGDGSATEYLPDGAGGFSKKARPGDWRTTHHEHLKNEKLDALPFRSWTPDPAAAATP